MRESEFVELESHWAKSEGVMTLEQFIVSIGTIYAWFAVTVDGSHADARTGNDPRHATTAADAREMPFEGDSATPPCGLMRITRRRISGGCG